MKWNVALDIFCLLLISMVPILWVPASISLLYHKEIDDFLSGNKKIK